MARRIAAATSSESRRISRDRFRRNRVRPAEVSHEDVGVSSTALATRTPAPEQRLDLATAFSALRSRERALLWLAYSQGASHKEIAEVIGVGTGSVKALLFRARRRLAGLLGRPEAVR